MNMLQAKEQFLRSFETGRRPKKMEEYRRNLNMFYHFISTQTIVGPDVHTITPEELDDYITRLREPWANQLNSCKPHITVLRLFFQFCQQRGWVSTDPSTKLTRFSEMPRE
ncbi:site-specific integrase [Alkalicoccus urumqiensis]|uniref:Core-binding (CB) domain-containing protein n=1 Tax=Alkalicoccus urumqiensis TaxID=1548213 RepID=A0A2P6MHQ8_ALKUR|nr:site-specific integrase [Alkalicoccus urumqiensis]PRO65811.1 hypothetical protein C6I21_07895 [Alkalicoccus urumqiensis]